MKSTPHTEAILDTVGEGVVTIDSHQTIRLVNREAERLFGYGRAELLGASVHTLMPEEYGVRHEAGFATRLSDPELANTHTYRQFEGLRKDGSRFPLELRLSFVRVEGEPFFTASVRDVTERVRAAAELERRQSQLERLNTELERERDSLREEVRSIRGSGEIVGESAALKLVLAEIDAVARTEATVLVLGESGVGKELVARAIHERSARSKGPLVRVNCASIPGALFESELFGHRRGAFPGAVEDRAGRLQLAHGGTLFLDEVGEVPLGLQGKLLRVLQERQLQRVGDDRTRPVDVRVVAATNRDLLAEVAAGRFCEDLSHRLGVFPVRVPPLRERGQDVLLLARHFARRAAARSRLPEPRLTRATEAALLNYPWPGNARELENVIERGVILAAGRPLQPEMLALLASTGARGSSRPAERGHASPATTAASTGTWAYTRPPRPTRDAVIQALGRQGGVVKRTAEELGVSRQALYRLMDRWDLR